MKMVSRRAFASSDGVQRGRRGLLMACWSRASNDAFPASAPRIRAAQALRPAAGKGALGLQSLKSEQATASRHSRASAGS